MKVLFSARVFGDTDITVCEFPAGELHGVGVVCGPLFLQVDMAEGMPIMPNIRERSCSHPGGCHDENTVFAGTFEYHRKDRFLPDTDADDVTTT